MNPQNSPFDLKRLGFDEWFQSRQNEVLGADFLAARVTAVNRDNYLVRSGEKEVLAELSGAFIFAAESPADFPVTGDWTAVQFHNEDTLAIIHRLFPRRTMLRRKAAGEKVEFQMVAANIDAAFIIQGADFDFNLRRLERYLIMVTGGGIEPIILLSKSDLVGVEELAQKVAAVKALRSACRVLSFSSQTGAGLEDVSGLIEAGKTYCLLGSSGVGKTTLLNRLLGRDAFETKTVRLDDGKGRHATTRRQLVSLATGAMVVDTPGIRELANIAADDAISGVFEDISGLADLCRFKDCSHMSEKGCAILERLQSGQISEERYQSYLKLCRESSYNELSLAERRQRDRKFGKLVKSAVKFDKRKT
jgi:ribosome biogenesis GTPase